MIVRSVNDAEIGRIVQKNFGVIGNVRICLESGGQRLGSINAEGWNIWELNIQDATGKEFGQMSKTWVRLASAELASSQEISEATVQLFGKTTKSPPKKAKQPLPGSLGYYGFPHN